MSVNKHIIVGHLGDDPEVNEVNDTTRCRLSIATNRRWGDGEDEQETNWHTVIVWGKQAQACGEYLTQGRQVYVEGRVQHDEGDDGEYYTQTVADVVNFLSGSEQPETSTGSDQDTSGSDDEPFDDDEIPF